jgi:hypothetical protein
MALVGRGSEGVGSGTRRRWQISPRGVGAVVLAGHGVTHLMGVALLWRLAEPGQLRSTDAHPAPGSVAGLEVTQACPVRVSRRASRTAYQEPTPRRL